MLQGVSPLKIRLDRIRNYDPPYATSVNCIKILFGLNLLRYFNAFKDESDLSFPPLIMLIDLGYFLFLSLQYW